MIRYEWKRLLWDRKGIWGILILLATELAVTLFFTQPYDKVLETHRTVYESYLTQVEGPLTQEKRDFIEAEMERLNQIHQEMEQLKMDYYSGAVKEEIYRETFDRLLPEDEKYTGFSKLYSQYIFVRESENRSFLYTGGWEVLLTDQEPDYLFLLTLIVLLTPIFCEEYACRMHEILLTQKRSAKYLMLAKVTVALTLTVGLTAVLQLLDLGYCAARFGLPDGAYSLQSLYSFGNAAKALTLWQSFWLQFALKLLGYGYAAVLILCLSVLLKKFALTLMACIAILPLPFLTIGNVSGFVPVPGPWALSIGSVYLNGGTGELSWLELGRLLPASAAIVGVMLHIIRRRNTNWQQKGRPSRKGVVCVLALSLFLTGCSKSEEAVIYNRSAAGQYETNSFLIEADYEGAVVTEKATGNSYAFPLTPMEGETVTCGNTCYGRGDFVWYLRTTTHRPNAGWDIIDTDCDLVKLDLGTMEESIVYQWNEETDWFFGLLNRVGTAPASFSVELLFVHECDLYYVDTAQSTMNRMNLNTGEYEVILGEMYSQDIAYDGTSLYYLDSYNRLVIRNLESGTEQAADEVVAKRFLLTQDGIYFENRRSNSDIYHWDSESMEIVNVNNAWNRGAIYCQPIA